MLMVAQTVVLRRRRGRMVNEGTKEDPSMETSALDPFFFFHAVDAVPTWHFLQHPAPIPHALQLLRI